jgi:VRR-NUC domain
MPTEAEFKEAVQRSLAASFSTIGAKCFPMIQIDDPRYHRRTAKMAADAALCYYRAHGFAGDRSLAASPNGYAAILRALLEPPPWVEVQMEDSVGDISAERSIQLRPLVQQVQDGSNDEVLLDRFREHRKKNAAYLQKLGVDSSPLEGLLETEFREKVALARLLGVDVANSLHDAVFDQYDGYQDIILSAGAPDLLVWLPNAETGFWFLSEVKAPGDYLSETQRAWLNENWHFVQGHYSVTELG